MQAFGMEVVGPDIESKEGGFLSGIRVPFSAMQQAMILQSQCEPGAGLYIQQLVCRLKEQLDEQGFREAWQRMVDRHGMFRASIDEQTQNQWVIHSAIDLPFRTFNWTGLSPGDVENSIEEWLNQDRCLGFDSAQGPLFRLSLFRLGPEDYYFIWTSHHALMDGRSRLRVLEEFFAVYQSLRTGAAIDLAATGSICDYLRTPPRHEFEKAEAFWREMFRGFEPSAPLGTRWDDSEPVGHGVFRQQLPVNLSDELRGFCAKNGLTLNTLLQGAWAILLSRYTDRQEAIFGATRACRGGAGGAGNDEGFLVGLLINTLPVRLEIPDEMPVLEWLQGVRAKWIALREFESTSLQEIHNWSGIQGPLFESLVVFERYRLESKLRAKGGEWLNRWFEVKGITNFPLVISGYEDRELEIEFTYQKSRFDHDAIVRMAGHLRRLFETMASHPNTMISALPVLTPLEEQTLLFDWNATSTGYPKESSIQEVFEARVIERPNATALVFGQERLSYAQLNSKANQLARSLSCHGVQGANAVGLFMERSPEMIVGFLGILKAGGICVPLDPGWPSERVAALMANADVNCLISHRATSRRIPFTKARVLCIEELELEEQLDVNLGGQTGGDSIASIMFTSGSTGRPKGARIRHRSVIRLVRETDYCQFGPEEIFLQFAPLCFDASTFEIWGSLLNGATLVIAPAQPPSLEELGQWIQEHRVTTLWLTASLFHEMVDGPIHLLSGLRQLLAGGDRLSPRHVRKFISEYPECRLINGYGPTENTTFTCCCPLDHDLVSGENVPIGRPISNSQVYILDRLQRPVPIGIAGEIWIGGDGLADGYFNAPELTQQKFQPDPFRSGSVLYRSGDRARYRSDGVIEFLGRIDGQVKIRGFRVELGEIEESLLQHPLVHQAAAIVCQYPSGEKYLAAFVVCAGAPVPTSDDLKSFLEKTLPEPMIPRVFCFLDALPMNANGKIDRRALPAAELFLNEVINIGDAPRTSVQTELARIWGKILGLSAIGIRENFFSIGGTSLAAMRIVSEIQKAFGVGIPLSQFLATPTIESLANRLDSSEVYLKSLPGNPTQFSGRASGSEIRAGSDCRIQWPSGVDCSGGLTSFKQENALRKLHSIPESAFLNIVRLLRFRGPLQVPALESSLNAVIGRHEALRSSFIQHSPGQFRRVVAAEAQVRLPLIDLEHLPENGQRLERVYERARDEGTLRFDFTKSPLVRCHLMRISEQDHVLVFSIHHLVCDGWSLGVIFSELGEIYSALVRGTKPCLRPVAVQYSQFVAWQRETIRGELLEKLDAFWRNYLAGPIRPFVFPFSKPRSEQPSVQGRILEKTLPRATSKELLGFATRKGVTPFIVLGGVYALLLHRISGTKDVVLNVPIAQRNDPQIQESVGYFSITVALRINLEGDPSFDELLVRVKESLFQVVAHADYPTSDLNRIVDNQANPNPIDQIGFAEVPPFRNGRFHQLEVSFMILEITNMICDFRIQIDRIEDQFFLQFHYRQDLFDQEDIQPLIPEFLSLLETVLDTPSLRVSTILGKNARAESQLSTKQESSLRYIHSRPESPYMNIVRILHLVGPLQTAWLEAGLNLVIQHHESLRTGFVKARAGDFRRVIADKSQVAIREVDLRGFAESERMERVLDYARQEGMSRFDFVKIPLIRCQLMRIGENEHALVFTIHHLICDGWSLGILFTQWGNAYSGLVQGNKVCLPNAPVQYSQFVEWQREYLSGETLNELAKFWQGYLPEPVAPYLMPFAKPRPAFENDLGLNIEEHLPRHLSHSIVQFAKDHKITPFMLLGTVFALALHRVTRRSDIFLSIPVAQRNDPQIHGMIGYVSTAVPLRVDFLGDPSLGQLLKRVKEDLLQVVAHSGYLNSEINRLGGGQFNPNPLTQFGFAEVPEYHRCSFHQVVSRFIPLDITSMNLDLRVQVTRRDHEFFLQFHYRPQLFDRENIVGLIVEYGALLDAALNSPDRQISKICNELILNKTFVAPV